MRIERRKRVVRALVAALIAAGQPFPAGAATPVPDREAGSAGHAIAEDAGSAGAPLAATGCPAAISCGGGCVAELSTGFCILAVSWTGGARIGGFQIGPTFRAECYICDCWYIYTSSSGNRIFKRTTDLGCSGSIGDLHVT